MDFSQINYLAVIVAAISTFGIGSLWYSKLLFGNAWMKAAGISEEDTKKANMAKTFGFAFVFSFIMSLNLALFLEDPETNASWGMMAGFLASFGWVAMAIGINGLFEQKSWTYILINSGYMIVSFVFMGLIIGLWR